MSRRTGADLKRENTFLSSFRHAADGVRAAWHERNFRIDVAAAVLALALCAVLRVPAWGWVAVIVCIGVQIALETINTAIESVVDLASPDIHPLAARAKDCAAGAALITACSSVVVAAIVYGSAVIGLVSA